jgi:hypothetical protein
MVYLYLEPKTTMKRGITGVLLIIVLTIVAMNYINIYLNWDEKSVQCNVDNIYLAYITGNMNAWGKKCLPE